MGHREEIDALRARIEALEEENAELTAQLVELTRLLEEATTTIGDLQTKHDGARVGARIAKAERAQREAEAKVRALEARIGSGPDIATSSFPARNAVTRLASAEQFAREGRGREALQIVLSVERTEQHPHARELLRRRVWCAKEKTLVRPPDDPEPRARFARGRCPSCGTFLELTDG